MSASGTFVPNTLKELLMQIIPLSEGAFTVDASKKFIPFDLEQDQLQQRNRGSLLVEIQPFVIKTVDEILLLDTGLGSRDAQGQMQLYSNLRQHQIHPGDVTRVIMSHLHKDHASGLINPFTGQFAFENALCHIQQQEWEEALQPGSSSYDSGLLEPLRDSRQLVLEAELEGEIAPGISYKVTAAHSRFHRVIWVREGDETAFFGADDAPQRSQMRTRLAAKYDYDGKKAMQLREQWMEEGRDWQFLFYHDIKTPVFRVKDL